MFVRLASCLAAIAAISTAGATPAFALNGRTFVSGHGIDSSACVLAAPCRTFQFAHDQTAAGGEISVLDTAGYGALTITKAISIVNGGGGEAAISVSGGAVAITVAADPKDLVSLRGLTIDGQGGGLYGILFKSGAALDVIDCNVRSFTAENIFFKPSTTSNFTIVNTVSSNAGTGGAGNGLYVAPELKSGVVSGSISRSTFMNSRSAGISIFSGNSAAEAFPVRVTISDSVLSNNQIGLFVGSNAISAGARAALVRDTISSNGQYGIQWSVTGTGASFNNAWIELAQSAVTYNPIGVVGAGAVRSNGNSLFLNDVETMGGSFVAWPAL